MQLNTSIRAGILTIDEVYCYPIAPVPAFPLVSTILQQSEIAAYGTESSNIAIGILGALLSKYMQCSIPIIHQQKNS